MEEDRWVTIQQAAEIVQVHPETLREWIRQGKLPANLLNRRAGYRIRMTDLREFMNAGTAEGVIRGKVAA